MSLFSRAKPYAQMSVAVLVSLVGIGVAMTAVGHLFDPEHIGLWSGPYVLTFGIIDDAMRAHQLPASTLYIVSVTVVAICFLVARELFGFARAGLKRQAR